MRFICLVFLAFIVNVNAGNVWLKDLVSPKGWDLGYGAVLKLNESPKGRNVPIMDRLSLDLNLGGLVGVSVGRAKSEGLELDFYVKKDVDYQEGRTRRIVDPGGRRAMRMMLGFMAAVVVSGIFGAMNVLTINAMMFAKLAVIMSLLGIFMKMKERQRPGIIEVQQQPYPSPMPHYPTVDAGNGYLGYGGGYDGRYAGGLFDHLNFGGDPQASNVYHDISYPQSANGNMPTDPNAAYSSATPSEPSIPITVARRGQHIQRRRDNYFNNMKNTPENDNILIKKYASIKTENR